MSTLLCPAWAGQRVEVIVATGQLHMSNATKDVVPITLDGAERFGLTRKARRLLLDDVIRGLADIAAGRTEDADTAIARLQERSARRRQR